MERDSVPNFETFLNLKPNAKAEIKGSMFYPKIQGDVWFYQTEYGVLVVADIEGLPNLDGNCNNPIFAFHIHNGSRCSGNDDDPFANVGTHYNPHNCLHPQHAGDLPPLFSANGNAFLAVLTSRFNVYEVIGKTVIIHFSPDDFTTQPSGNSGVKIACGEIKAYG